MRAVKLCSMRKPRKGDDAENDVVAINRGKREGKEKREKRFRALRDSNGQLAIVVSRVKEKAGGAALALDVPTCTKRTPLSH